MAQGFIMVSSKNQGTWDSIGHAQIELVFLETVIV
jgi:hypothetical protein